MVEKNLLTIPILEGIEKSEGCPLCYLWSKSEKQQTEHLLTNEVTMDPGVREKVLTAKGFCNRHMHLIYKTAFAGGTEDGLGFTLYMQGVVREINQQLRSTNMDVLDHVARRRAFSLLNNSLERAVQGQRPCPVCESLWSSDKSNSHTLVQMLDDRTFREQFRSSNGLCLSHFISVLRMVSGLELENPTNIARTLVEVEIERLRLVENYLSEFVRKSSWDFRNEPVGPEANANPMVLNLLAGVEGLYCRGYRSFSTFESETR